MSLLQRVLFGPTWSDMWDYPSHVSDQHFGLLSNESYLKHRLLKRQQKGLVSGTSDIRNDKDVFQVRLDVSDFNLEELSVKVVDSDVVIHGKHEEKPDQHGYIQREFTRRYALPPDVEPDRVVSSLSSEGYLTIESPKKHLQLLKPNERYVPIALRSASSVASDISTTVDSTEQDLLDGGA